MPSAVCFGEVLWDVFPTHKKIGGAPLNVALRMKALGIETQLISRVGDDQKGQEIIDYLKGFKLKTDLIQKDAEYKTGEVLVTLDNKGSASYIIEAPVAWDKIDLTEQNLIAVASADIFVFGSLASRDKQTKASLLGLLKKAKYKVFDVNLRPPFYSIPLLQELMETADFIKCNDEELREISLALGFKDSSIEAQLEFLSKRTNTSQICVTLGEDGAFLIDNYKIIKNSGYKVKVEDTVGAGDTFLAGLISNLALKIDPELALARACALGALVASKKGANPAIDPLELEKILASK